MLKIVVNVFNVNNKDSNIMAFVDIIPFSLLLTLKCLFQKH